MVANEALTCERVSFFFCVAKPFRQGKAKRATSRTCGNESDYKLIPIGYFFSLIHFYFGPLSLNILLFSLANENNNSRFQSFTVFEVPGYSSGSSSLLIG